MIIIFVLLPSVVSALISTFHSSVASRPAGRSGFSSPTLPTILSPASGQGLFKAVGLVAILLSVSGCSSISSSLSNISRETPYHALTSLTETVACIGNEINNSDSQPVMLLVDDFFDGTVPVPVMTTAKVPRENGPLADGGKYDFEAIVKRSVSSRKISIPYSIPPGMLQEDVYGLVQPEYLKNLSKLYGVSRIIKVKGVFTQNDASDYNNKGFGSGAGTEGKHGEAEIEYGISESARSLSLAIYLSDATKNMVGAATVLTLNTYTKSDEFSVGFGYGEGTMSFATQEKIKEGMHGAQRTLIEAAAMWALRGIYNNLDFSRCLSADGPSPEAAVAAHAKWRSLDDDERMRRLKSMLKELQFYAGSIDGSYDVELQKAIAAYEVKNNLLVPHTRDNLADLFVLLYLRIGPSKADALDK